MNLIIYYPNIYVNNRKFISIVDNVVVFQSSLDSLGTPIDNHENLSRVGFNSIASVHIVYDIYEYINT